MHYMMIRMHLLGLIPAVRTDNRSDTRAHSEGCIQCRENFILGRRVWMGGWMDGWDGSFSCFAFPWRHPVCVVWYIFLV
jgi:hypothetical protein